MMKHALKEKGIQTIPDNYQHPARHRKTDKAFIERQLKVNGYKLEISAFYYLTNDPRSNYL